MTEQSQTTATKTRPPIIVIMGHVDHGKTTLLDYIRKSNVASREAGGITQAISAYEILHNGKKMTFIDTPGHEAFTRMRSRGATIADLAVLVVAAEEGVKPQTKEAIDILNETKTPFVVAINKIDKHPDLERAKNELMAAGVLLEGYGGNVSFHGISAKTGEGVSDLLDLLALSAEVENLTFNPKAPASGFVLETRMDRRRGSEAVVIIKDGTLKRGDDIYTATALGKAKILEDFLGKTQEALEASAPALIIGFETLPQIGEEFTTAGPIGSNAGVVVKKQFVPRIEKPTLFLVLKASDAGSLEALSLIVKNLESEKKAIEILDASVGDISDNDMKFAISTGAIILGFKNRVEKGAKNLAEAHEVTVITSDIIYELVKAVEDFITGQAGPKAIGKLEVLAIFNQKKLEKQLVGGRITEGIIRLKAPFDVMRKDAGDKPAAIGRVLSVHEGKKEITEAGEGKEIGIIANCPIAIVVGDILVVKKP